MREMQNATNKNCGNHVCFTDVVVPNVLSKILIDRRTAAVGWLLQYAEIATRQQLSCRILCIKRAQTETDDAASHKHDARRI